MNRELRGVIWDAMRIIAESADALKAGCALGDEWPDAEDKAVYDEHVAVLNRLEAFRDAEPTAADASHGGASVPEGFALVPSEPTEIWTHAVRERLGCTLVYAAALIRDVLGAAPHPSASATAAPAGEPVGEVRRAHYGGRAANIGVQVAILYPDAKVMDGTKLYAQPASAAPAGAGRLDDRRIADTVNTIRDIAIQYRDTQQLRERIAHVLVPLLTARAADTPEASEPVKVYPQGVMGIPPYSPRSFGSVTCKPGLIWNAGAPEAPAVEAAGEPEPASEPKSLTDEQIESLWYENMGHSISSGRMKNDAIKFARALLRAASSGKEE